MTDKKVQEINYVYVDQGIREREIQSLQTATDLMALERLSRFAV